MNALVVGLLALSLPVSAGPMEDCVSRAHDWFDGLAGSGCPTMDRYLTAAVDGCRSMPEDGWSRTQKTARKAILSDCKPTKKGFPGAQATLADGNTSSRCSELLRLVQGLEGDRIEPAETAWGIDRMMAATSSAIFACHAPNEIDLCRLPTSVQTPAGQIEQRRKACTQLDAPPLDSTMRILAANSGLLPVNASERIAAFDQLLKDQEDARAQRKIEDERFQAERTAEVERARQLSDQCMKLPGDMNTAAETVTAAAACSELQALWKGADTVRKDLEASGSLAERYAKQLVGKVLNAESLNAGDPKRVASRPAVLEERRMALVNAEFDQLIQQDPSAAEKLVDTYRALMGPDWTAEALDQLLAAGH